MFKTILRHTKVLWSASVLLSYVILAFSLKGSGGHQDPKYLVVISLTLALLLVSTLRPGTPVGLNLERWFAATWLLFSFSLCRANEVLYAVDNLANLLLKAGIVAQFLIALGYVFTVFRSDTRLSDRTRQRILMGAIALGFLLYVLVIFVSPAPFIDIFWILTQGADHLSGGQNPYLFQYPDIYDGQYDYTDVVRFIYWPVVTWSVSLSRWVLGDIRWAYVIAHGLTLLGLGKIARSVGLSRKEGFLFILIWLSFPVGLVVMEQTWVEVFLLPSFAFLVLFLLEERWIPAAIMLGVLCATKQFVIFTAIYSCIYLYRHGGGRQTILFMAVCAVICLGIMFPFLVHDWKSFVEVTVMDLLRYKMREDSLSWVAYLSQFHAINLSGAWLSLSYLATTLLFSFWMLFKKHLTTADFCLAQVITYGVVFLLGKQAFLNYYYFMAAILCVSLALNYSRARGQETHRAPPRRRDLSPA